MQDLMQDFSNIRWNLVFSLTLHSRQADTMQYERINARGNQQA